MTTFLDLSRANDTKGLTPEYRRHPPVVAQLNHHELGAVGGRVEKQTKMDDTLQNTWNKQIENGCCDAANRSGSVAVYFLQSDGLHDPFSGFDDVMG